MKSISYDPKVVEITAGQTVVWKNVSYTDHSARTDGGPSPFNTGMVAPGHASKPVTFTTAGEFPYHCGMHGTTMSGVVKVKAAAP
jgi:plastocyanin